MENGMKAWPPPRNIENHLFDLNGGAALDPGAHTRTCSECGLVMYFGPTDDIGHLAYFDFGRIIGYDGPLVCGKEW